MERLGFGYNRTHRLGAREQLALPATDVAGSIFGTEAGKKIFREKFDRL